MYLKCFIDFLFFFAIKLFIYSQDAAAFRDVLMGAMLTFLRRLGIG